MTMWLLAVLLLASLAALGLRQGAIRVAFSFVGIIFAALLAVPVGRLVRPLLGLFGMKDPLLLWVIPPLIAFILINVLFKIAALMVHQKVEVHFKYRTGDLRLALWERLNHRVGMCLGILNGAAYLILISFVIFACSYWTVQMSSPEGDPMLMRLVTRMGKDMQATGFHRVAHSIDRLKPQFYETADIAGLMFNNSLLEARLSRYPGFLGLAERPEFQELGGDLEFAKMRQTRQPLMSFLHYPKIEGIIRNPDLLKSIKDTVIPDLPDLRKFLETGRSPKYEALKIVGRWSFDINSAMVAMRRARPNLPSSEMTKIKRWMMAAFEKTGLVAMPDHHVVLKNLPGLKITATPTPPQTFQGEWKDLDGGKYQLALEGNDLMASLDGDRMTINTEGMSLIFNRED